MSIERDELEHPSDNRNNKFVAEVQNVTSLSNIAEELGISYGSCQNILTLFVKEACLG
jgi:hypothetical protein